MPRLAWASWGSGSDCCPATLAFARIRPFVENLTTSPTEMAIVHFGTAWRGRLGSAGRKE
eukprot:2341357-Pleurochrysis_carterae.AAC.1